MGLRTRTYKLVSSLSNYHQTPTTTSKLQNQQQAFQAQRGGGGGGGFGGKGGNFDDGKPAQLSLEMTIPANVMGHVIGPKGATIASFRTQTGVHCQVLNNSLTADGEFILYTHHPPNLPTIPFSTH